jgi:pseudouridylate synthase
LEYLETMGVPVLGFKTDDFPAFYTQKSGLKVDFRLESAAEIADFLQKKWIVAGLSGGILIANPIPEKYSMPALEIEKIIDEAVKLAAKNGIRGKETTPFLLKKIKELTHGESLESNIALVLNNARLAANISVHFAAFQQNPK